MQDLACTSHECADKELILGAPCRWHARQTWAPTTRPTLCAHTWATCCMQGTQLSGEPLSRAASGALPPRRHPAASQCFSLGPAAGPGFKGTNHCTPLSLCSSCCAHVTSPKLHVYCPYPSEQLSGAICKVMLWCRYDMTRANLVDPELEKYVQRGLSLPDVVLVSCQRLCCCTPACPSLAAAAQHDSSISCSIMLHCWVCPCRQLTYLLLASASPD